MMGSVEEALRHATDPLYSVATGRTVRWLNRFDRTWQKMVCFAYGHDSDDDGWYGGPPHCVWCDKELDA